MDSKKHSIPPFNVAPITIIVGHYGVGKTNLSLNIARDIAADAESVTLVDLDIVNPYFRSSDYKELLDEEAVRLIAPTFAGTTLDSPSISGAIYPAVRSADSRNIVLIDVGGDDVGATSLGRFADEIKDHEYEMYYVVNKYRNLTQDPQEAAEVLREIERVSGLKATGVINNSHLKEETTASMIEQSYDFAQSCADLLGLPLLATTIPLANGLCEKSDGTDKEPKKTVHFPSDSSQTPYLVRVYVHTPWEMSEIN